MMIRKFMTGALMALFTLTGTASCGSGADDNKKGSEDNKTETMENIETEGKKLVVFFSHSGENYNVGNIEKGNTHIIADMIAEMTGADSFEIVPEKEYPEKYDDCIDVAKKELQEGARPAVKGDVKIEDYDVVFVGYPQWWGEPPMCVYTFLEKHDWNGKIVIPFVTHEGSGMGGTDRKIASVCKGADVAVGKGLAVQGSDAQNKREVAHKNVEKWLGELGFIK